MSGWVFVGYGVVGFLLVRPVAGAVAWSSFRSGNSLRRKEPDTGLWIYGLALGVLAGVLWPIAAFWWLQGRGDAWSIGAERAERLDARERRIKEMEKEVGLR